MVWKSSIKNSPIPILIIRSLHSDDAENDFVLFFIEMIKLIKLEGFKSSNSDYQLLAFISKAMYNEFIRLSKAKNLTYRINYNIVLKYWFRYSNVEVGSRMNVTWQTVNRIILH